MEDIRGKAEPRALPESLTVAVCTKNRHSDLGRCIESIGRAHPPATGSRVQILVIDDGEAPEAVLVKLSETLRDAGYRFEYYQKRERFGLFQSRLLAFERADGDVVLFLDDDVEIDCRYLVNLLGIYQSGPGLAGVGGVNILPQKNSRVRRAYGRLFLYDSGRPGRLSASGGAKSAEYWLEQDRPFETDFLSGCNMSFRKTLMQDLVSDQCLEGYSVGEDLFLSLHARRKGTLIVDPSLQVRHHYSGISRENRKQVAFAMMVNHYNLLRQLSPSRWSRLAFTWMVFGHFLNSMLRPARAGEALAYLRGFRHALRAEATDALSISRGQRNP